jgi:uncharacterized protein (DUF362 family)
MLKSFGSYASFQFIKKSFCYKEMFGVLVPLDTPSEVRAESFRGMLDTNDAGPYRALQESVEEYPEAEVPELRRPRLKVGGKSLVAVARGKSRAESIRLAVELLGGIRHVIDTPQPILLKPNFNSADPFPASSHPDHLETLLELLREAGCEDIDIGEMGGLLSLPASRNFERWGMTEFQERNGNGVVLFDEAPWVKGRVPAAHRWGGWIHCQECLLRSGQHIISAPTMKSHGGGPRFSLSLKNGYGFVHPRDRVRAHFVPQMAEMIMETNLLYSPSLVVIDGTQCWIAGGPYTGELRDSNVIIAGDDRIAVDVVGASVIRAMGSELLRDYPIWSHRQIRRAVELGLGAQGPEEMEILAEDATGSADFPDFMAKIRGYSEERVPE